ncbi:hypothetical protein [Klebsiella michiganensis]|uniref:hypothetical protein n=1 Tax=Klebsiella michiganensis TaxID=1134687 RepID=UPI001CCFAA4F|nr:hypothetical protein [Klebsiella michiganensis]
MDNKISINKIIADIKATKGNRSGCQGLSSSLESDGYITSICKWVRATSPDRINALVEHVEKQDAALIAWEKTMMEVCGEDGPASVASEIRNLRALRDISLTALRAQVKQLAAENKMAVDAVTVFSNVTHDVTEIICDELGHDRVAEIVAAYNDLGNMPSTDRIVAGIKADGRAEGINFAAGRLAAAFNHGFVDKPMAEVFDVVRMILTAKEDLANDPAADGLSGEYAEKSLAEWEAALREGADK